ncbi:DNA topoisomerase, partial [Hydrogenivirga sp. 128-5-R1-1]|uniref:DNA topoisomerase n=1 Tax=Hydrogenivirga sp. 128-5-R1-1 TaxID=392423 RepID=UPI00015F1D16
AGLITYHRTDSIRVSPAGVAVAKEYITENFGEEYFHPRTFVASGGAHECIRPTRPTDADDLRSMIYTMNLTGITKDHIRLYDLIFKQFMASQMRETVVEKTTYKVMAFDKEIEISLFTKIVENGFNLIKPITIQKLSEGKYEVDNKKFSLRPKVPYYTYATVIQDMKEKEIGRPSTYAITIEKLLERRYIVERNGYLFPTKLGRIVLNLIKEKEDFYKFVNEKFTRELENLMDKVENNDADYNEIIKNLFNEIVKHFTKYKNK